MILAIELSPLSYSKAHYEPSIHQAVSPSQLRG